MVELEWWLELGDLCDGGEGLSATLETDVYSAG